MSNLIDVKIGTEQGHPMSPELFKMFLYDFSTEIELLLGIEIPNLNDYKISHLLWADDLILLAEDARSLQKLLDVLNNFTTKWELSVNISKTNVMVFNTSSKLLNCSFGFKLGNNSIIPTKQYTYLGITFSLNGSFIPAMVNLSTKALRAYFSMKRTLNVTALTCSSMLKLFDCLIRPIATYSSQIWLPSTKAFKAIVHGKELIPSCTKDKLELTHLKMLKWMCGIHKKASNLFCYGDSGRIPLSIGAIGQGIKYYRRVRDIDDSNGNNYLVKHAFQEQKSLSMDWYTSWMHLDSMEVKDKGRNSTLTPTDIQSSIANQFICEWDKAIETQNKLSFYSSVKSSFGEELYLSCTNYNSRKSIAQLRSSAHDLNIEKGRYTNSHNNTGNFSLLNRLCRFCCSGDEEEREALEMSANLPFFEPIIENEQHVLTECPKYHHLRLGTSDGLKILLARTDYNIMMQRSEILDELGRYLSRCRSIRNPPKEKIKKTST